MANIPNQHKTVYPTVNDSDYRNLSELVNDRGQVKDTIRELTIKLDQIERATVEKLLNERRIEFLKVDWVALERAEYHGKLQDS